MNSWSYQYGVGGLVFLAGLWFGWRQGYLGLRGRPLGNLILMLGGLGFFAGLQAWLQAGPMNELPANLNPDGYQTHGVLGTTLDYAVVAFYFVGILIVGTWFGRRQKTTKDFFFGGQRFAWWLIAFSLLATTVGSYSFVKYSEQGFKYGLSSSQTYLNDWLWVPLLAFGWLPILYFSRITSIPEYFERRFDRPTRLAATIVMLIYLVGYIGVNLFTMGTAINQLIRTPVFWSAAVVALVSMAYVTAGGQTSVIMTDLFQGVMLMIVGLLILGLGIAHVGGWWTFWDLLPRVDRLAFHNFNADPSFPSVGIFWQDGMANSAVFYFAHQGILMRFMAAKSVSESRKAAYCVPLILMPLAACVVASGGWVARALVQNGTLSSELGAKEAFFVASEFLSRPGMFGLVLAALTAALMSTIDTIVTAVSAVVVNDLYRPYFRPDAGQAEQLKVARLTAVGVTIIGILLVLVFQRFDSIYEAHGAFTAAATPPLAVALLLSVFWPRFTRQAAFWTLVGGGLAIALSALIPGLVAPFAHGVPPGGNPDSTGLLAGFEQYKFMRACYGIAACGVIGVVVTLLTRAEPEERRRGLVWGTVRDAVAHYKGAPGEESAIRHGDAMPVASPEEFGPPVGEGQLPQVRISTALAEQLEAKSGDLLYVTDSRWWLGGLCSTHAVVADVVDGNERQIWLGPGAYEDVVSLGRADDRVKIERLY